jgi:hypothetical protein
VVGPAILSLNIRIPSIDGSGPEADIAILKRFLCYLFAYLLLQGAAAAATLTLSRTTAPPGAAITITGAAFTPNSIVDVYLDLQQVAFQITSSTGAFTFTTNVPVSHKPGPHTVTVMPHSGTGAAAQRVYLVRTDWLSWKGDVSNRGWNRTENVLNYLNVQDADHTWTGPKTIYSAVAVAGSNFYFVGSDGTLNAYSRSTRARVYSVAANASPLIPPTVAGGYVVVARNGGIAAFSSTTGALIWQASLPSAVGVPTIHGLYVYVTAEGSADAGVYVFRINCGTGGATCTPTWRGVGGLTGGSFYPEAGLAIGDGKVFASLGETLYSYPLNCATGGNICNPITSRAGVAITPPVYVNGYVIIGSGTSLLALDPDCVACSPRWSATLTTGTYRTPTVAGSRVYVMDGDSMRVFSVSCGSSVCAPLGSTVVGSSGMYSPTVANGVTYVATPLEILAYSQYCVSNCAPIWQAGSGGVFGNAPYATVSVVDGVIYAPDENGMKIYEVPAPRSATKSMIDMASLQPDPRFADAEAAWQRKLAARRR